MGDQLKPPKGAFNSKNELKEFDKRWTQHNAAEGSLEKFELYHVLGEGSFGKVVLIRYKNKNEFYAMKILDKDQIVKSKQIDNSIAEKRVLYAMKYHFCVNLHIHFQDNASLYLVLEYAAGGDLFDVFYKFQKFNEQMTKFYTSQIFLAIDYLHLMEIMHRDLKPENVLITADGYLKLTDFGFAKRTTQRAWTFCGTPEYIAPEIIKNKGYNKSCDWWAWGVMVYEMVNGKSPFHSKDQMSIFEKICIGRVPMPGFFSESLKDLLKNVIQADITKRYGNLKGGSDDIRKHKWLADCNLDSIYFKKVKPPYVPVVKNPLEIKVPKKPNLKKTPNNKYGELFKDF